LCLLTLLAVLRLGARVTAHAAEPCGTETCIVCHEEQGEVISSSIHGSVSGEDEAVGCESCHGPSAGHCEDPGAVGPMMAFKDTDPSADRLSMCLSCHAGGEKGSHFKRSPHLKGGVTCEQCHQPHYSATKDRLLPGRVSSVCLGCHEEKLAASFLNERHRMIEEMVSCVDCHNQHGPSARAQLGGFKQEMCYKCHTDKQGPFLYEHLGVRIERCSTCHDPHGSVNRHLLHYQSVADLCFTCHVEVPGFHTRFTAESQCTNCHVTIHGSNLHPAFLD
jgi:DmsE family decaheme c-type cytochrome